MRAETSSTVKFYGGMTYIYIRRREWMFVALLHRYATPARKEEHV